MCLGSSPRQSSDQSAPVPAAVRVRATGPRVPVVESAAASGEAEAGWWSAIVPAGANRTRVWTAKVYGTAAKKSR